MEQTKEISALLNLIDDPDEEVFGAVSNKILDFGRTIIPNLEHLWETTPDEQIQERIELIIHRLHYTDLTEDFLISFKIPIPRPYYKCRAAGSGKDQAQHLAGTE
jgi:alpha-D-ribose 1-methylphosphonate 5-phosphate C-P lyase